ncbi:MAG TPA: hypothetical protein VFZ76_11625 [Anaerolineales bacterium]
MENKHSEPRPIDAPEEQAQNPVSYLAQEYARWQALFRAQPVLIRHFIESQAKDLADALIQPLSQTRFALPDRVVIDLQADDEPEIAAPIPPGNREQLVGGLLERLTRTGLSVLLRQRLDELEASAIEGVSVSAGLIRFATALYMVHDLLPSGRSVTYFAAEGEEIPTIPSGTGREAGSALTAKTDAITEESEDIQDEERGELLVPYVPAARRFYLPQWVAFDDRDRLLVGSVNEAESYLASMQRFLRVLHSAVALAPYMVADDRYQSKRYGMLGQLINQGRALARYQTRQIIASIQERAAAHDLNRGLSLSLPYFDDQDLEMKSHDFDVIPAGRIMFIPGLVVLAGRKEQVKVHQDTRLSRSTRDHLLNELQMIEIAFEASGH